MQAAAANEICEEIETAARKNVFCTEKILLQIGTGVTKKGKYVHIEREGRVTRSEDCLECLDKAQKGKRIRVLVLEKEDLKENIFIEMCKNTE